MIKQLTLLYLDGSPSKDDPDGKKSFFSWKAIIPCNDGVERQYGRVWPIPVAPLTIVDYRRYAGQAVDDALDVARHVVGLTPAQHAAARQRAIDDEIRDVAVGGE